MTSQALEPDRAVVVRTRRDRKQGGVQGARGRGGGILRNKAECPLLTGARGRAGDTRRDEADPQALY